LDRLDVRILKVLLVNNGVPPGNPALRKSFRSIAKDLGVDQGTIRKRMKRLQEQRVLRGWYLGVSPGLTGHDVVHAWVEVKGENAKGDLISRLISDADTERACNYLGPKVSIVLFSKKGTDYDATMEHLSEMVGRLGALHKQGVVPVPARSLRKTDAAIVASLCRDPWKSFATIAGEIGLSERTVKRRVTKLSEEGAIYMLPIVDLKALQGIVPVELVVDYASKELRAAVNKQVVSYVKEGLLFSDSSGPFGYFALIVPNVSQVEQIEQWARRLHGVKSARAEVLQDVILNRKHYEAWSTILSSPSDERQMLAQPARA
jgi:DNA-binding Lrp family transcriptional regulator